MGFDFNGTWPPKNLDLRCRCVPGGLTIDDIIENIINSIFEKAERPINPDELRTKAG